MFFKCNDYNQQLYGYHRNRTFTQVFKPTPEDIAAGRDTSESVFNYLFTSDDTIPLTIKEESLKILFYLLYSRYGQDIVASSDENMFKFSLRSIVFMYGPTWEKRLELQQKIRELTDEELEKGGKAIYNTANAPGTKTASITNSEGILDYLSGQNTTSYKKSKIEAYSYQFSLLETDVTKEFIDKFKSLFNPFVMYETPAYYYNVIKEEN